MHPTSSANNKVKIIFLAGLLVGTLDILTACTDYYIATGKSPAVVLRSVASGVFCKDAFTGSDLMLLWGLLFHYIIAFSFTIFFFWLYRKLKVMASYPILTAVVYGIFMWVITTRVVMPLSNAATGTFHFWKAIKAILILVVMISLPLSVIAKKYFAKGLPSNKFSTST